MRRDGFTLVELLVVIAVIGVLIGVLLPSLGGARARAWQAGGASNIRQLQLANTMHAGDHDERFMPAAVDIVGPANVRSRENTHRWHGLRDAPSGAFDPEGAPMTVYLDDSSHGVRRCPAFASTLESLEASGRGFESGCGGYAYNAAFVGSSRVRSGDRWTLETRRVSGRGIVVTGDDHGARRPRFHAPARTVAFADAALATSEVVEYSFAEPPFWPDYPGFRPDPSIHFRHRDQANVCWLDGHVSGEAMALSSSSGVYPLDPGEHDIGWFGDTSSNAHFDYE